MIQPALDPAPTCQFRRVHQGDDSVMEYAHRFLDVVSNLPYGEADEPSLLLFFFFRPG